MDTSRNIELRNLQNALALVDHNEPASDGNSAFLLERLLVKKDQIKVKMYQEKGHGRPHLHLDYGSTNHTCSFAIDTGERLEGDLSRRYDRVVQGWIANNREALLSIWAALQAGVPEGEYVSSLLPI